MKPKQCQECGQVFQPKNGFQKFCLGPHTTECTICHKVFTYTCRPSEKPSTCSRACQTELQHRTTKQRHGVDNVSQIPGVYNKSIDKVKSKVSRKIKTCKWCGKQFYGRGSSVYCEGPHYNICEVCNHEFEVDPRQPKRACSPRCKQILIERKLSEVTKICEECGKPFHPRGSMSRFCEGPHFKPCQVCGKPVKYKPGSSASDVNCCSRACSVQLGKQTCQDKYGADFYSQTAQAREDARLHAKEMQSQKEQTCLEIYGVPNPAMNPDVKAKISATVASEECQNRMQATMVERHGVKYAAQSREVHQKAANTRKRCVASDGTALDSSYELGVYEFCLRNGLTVNRQIPIKYNYQDQVHTTLVDFEIDGQFFECKGSHLLEGCFDYANVPIDVKLDIYKKNHVVVITDSNARSIFGKPNSLESNGLKYLHKCPEPLIGVDIDLFINPEFPYRDDRPKCFYDVKVDGQRSAFEAFQDEKLRWDMIVNRIQYSGGFIDSKQVLNAMNVTRTCKQPSWFSKNLAKHIISEYCSSDVVVDPFAGWGTRADAVNELHRTYIGGDFNRELVEWHHSKGRTNISYCDATEFVFSRPCSVFICPPYSDPKTGKCFEDYNFEGFDDSAKTLTQCQWLEVVRKNVPNASEYVMVCKIVDPGYEKYIVDTKANKSHFGLNNEFILVIPNN